MSDKDSKQLSLETLATTLDAYGSDLSRMPAELGTKVRELIETSPAAKTLFEEAQKLDAALSDYMAPRGDTSMVDFAALQSRIMAHTALDASEQPGDKADNIIEFAPASSVKAKQPRAENKATTPATPAPANDNSFSALAASGLLAASLLFGVFFGAFGGADSFFGTETEMTMASTTLSDDILYLGTEYNLDIVDDSGN